MTPIRLQALLAAFLAGVNPVTGGIFSDEGSTGLRWSGSFLTDMRVRLEEPWEFRRREFRLSLHSEASFGRKGRFFADTRLRHLGFASPRTASDLTEAGEVLPAEVLLREAYFDVYGLFFQGLDLRVGRQLVPWGSAYMINPTSTIDAHDLEDIFTFGESLGSDALKLSWYAGNATVEAVAAPLFRPAVLPDGVWDELAEDEVSLPTEIRSLVDPVHMEDTLDLPRTTPAEGAVGGLRASTLLLGLDWSLSYVYGRDDFPAPRHIQVGFPDTAVSSEALMQAMATESPIPVSTHTTMVFPRRHNVGLDCAGALGDLGVWAEAALFCPEQVVTTARLETPVEDLPPAALALMPENIAALLQGKSVAVDTVLDDTPYWKLTAGGDYTWKNGFYINAQYVHGFMYERGENLSDFIVAETRWDLLGDMLTITPIGLGLGVSDFEAIDSSYTLLYQPEITWKPFDNLGLTAGVRVVDAGRSSTFSALSRRDHGYFRGEYVF